MTEGSATSLGIVIPILKDADQVRTPFGQLVVPDTSVAEIATIVLLSLFFSGEASGLGVKLLLLGLFGLFVLAVGTAVLGAEHSKLKGCYRQPPSAFWSSPAKSAYRRV